MQLKLSFIAIAAGTVLFAASCKQGPSGQSHGPIKLGDTATIVTERDSQYLRDFVADIQPRPVEIQPEEPPADLPKEEKILKETPPKEEPKPAAPAPVAAPKGNGLSVEFQDKDVNVFIPNVTARGSSKQSTRRSGAAFSYNSGNLNGNQLQISGMTVESVQQRYQTSVVMDSDEGTLMLDALNYTSDWAPLKGNGTNYSITGLDPRHLENSEPDHGEIQSALKKALRRKHVSRKAEQEILSDVRNVRSANQRPLRVMLRTVIWQIDGKDAKGKKVHKEVRLDMPA